MKTLITIFLIILLSACQEDKYCFTCTVIESGQLSEFTKCDITQSEAIDIEQAGTIIDPESNNVFVVTLNKRTDCRIKAD